MQIIEPTYITDATLISSDITESTSDIPVWDPTYAYVTGQRVAVTDAGVHAIYECLWNTPACLDKYPPDYLTGTQPYWLRISATNLWKLFDTIIAPDSASIGMNVVGAVWDAGNWDPGTTWTDDSYSSLKVSVAPGLIDTVALMNLDCTSLTIILTDPVSGEVYNENKIASVASGFNAIYEDLPSYPNAILDVIVRNTAGDVKVGELIVGKARNIGKSLYGVGIGIVDYSVKEADDFGNFTLLQRAYSKRVDCKFTMPLATHSGTMRLLEKYRSVPLVWIISNLYSTTIAYGFYRDLKVSIPFGPTAMGSLSIEGLGGAESYSHLIPDIWVNPWDGRLYLIVPGVPTVAIPVLSKIEEAPVAPASPIALTVPAVPAVAVSSVVYSLADTDGVCTISHAAPAVVSIVGHGLSDDQEVLFQTTGALPLPLIAGTHYFVVYIGVDTFNLSMTAPGSTIDTTTDGSGTHKVLGKVT